MTIPKYVIIDRNLSRWLLVWWGEQVWSVYWALIVVWFPTQNRRKMKMWSRLTSGMVRQGTKRAEKCEDGRGVKASHAGRCSLSFSLPLSRTLRYTPSSIIAGRDVLSKSRVICLVNRTQLTNKTGHPSVFYTNLRFLRAKKVNLR